jgi:competence protein ComEC
VGALADAIHFDFSGDSMAKACALFIALILITVKIAPDFRERWIVWNVGQGQWVTYIEAANCWHFDMGGEHPPWSKVQSLCRTRQNFVFLSHWDWDHIGFVGQAAWHLPEICLLGDPGGPGSPHARAWIHQVDMCEGEVPFYFWTNTFSRNSNGWSRVAIWKGVLLPGDSTKVEEKKWHFQLAGISQTRILMLGHHGSRSSTSKTLLASLPNLKMAIASSRRARYGHPHAATIKRLVEAHIPLLTTEDWGTIEIW